MKNRWKPVCTRPVFKRRGTVKPKRFPVRAFCFLSYMIAVFIVHGPTCYRIDRSVPTSVVLCCHSYDCHVDIADIVQNSIRDDSTSTLLSAFIREAYFYSEIW